MDALFHPDMMGDDLESWLDESALMKRTFGQCAQISGLIHRNLPGKEKNSRQVSFSSDLIYDVLRSHEPDHILLQAARQDAATGLLDVRRLSDALVRIRGKIDHQALEKISPFAVPVMLEIASWASPPLPTWRSRIRNLEPIINMKRCWRQVDWRSRGWQPLSMVLLQGYDKIFI